MAAVFNDMHFKTHLHMVGDGIFASLFPQEDTAKLNKSHNILNLCFRP